MTVRAKAVFSAFLLFVAAPTAALACPLCIAAQDKGVQVAYMIASAFMTFLPFVLVGSLVFWLRRRAKQLALEEAAGVIRLPTPTPGSRSNRAA